MKTRGRGSKDLNILWTSLMESPSLSLWNRNCSKSGRTDVVRKVAWILKYKSLPNADKGGGSQISQNFLDITSGIPFISWLYLSLLIRDASFPVGGRSNGSLLHHVGLRGGRHRQRRARRLPGSRLPGIRGTEIGSTLQNKSSTQHKPNL